MVVELLRKKGAYFVGTLAMTKWLKQFFAILAPHIYMLVIDLPQGKEVFRTASL